VQGLLQALMVLEGYISNEGCIKVVYT
jgi:hypothetical protein